MKGTAEVDCTPQEARAFLGLPDVTPLNEHVLTEMQANAATSGMAGKSGG